MFNGHIGGLILIAIKTSDWLIDFNDMSNLQGLFYA